MSAVKPPLRAAIYTRISADKDGEGHGVDNQEAECRVLAERLGWEVIEVYVDNDISAYSGKPRPGYRAMLEAVRTGAVQGVIAWNPDRLHRRNAELEPFITLAEAHNLQIQTVTSGDVDLTTPDGQMVARMLGAAAQREVATTRNRVRLAKTKAAEAGKYRGGPRPYGYDEHGITLREDEAQVVREATAAVIEGRSLMVIARELNAHGLRTSRGAEWDYQAVRDVVLRPRNAGLIHRGRPGREPFEIVGPALWPAIVEREQWDKAYLVLTDPSRRKQDGTSMRWLGTNIYRCGRCGGPMRIAPHGGTASRQQTRRWHYRCTATGHLTIESSSTDDFVRKVVANLLRDPSIVATMTEPDPHLDEYRAQRSALDAKVERFDRALYDGHLTPAEYRKAKDQALAELEKVEGLITTSYQRTTSSSVLESADPAARFLAAPIDVQRAVLRALVVVTIAKATARGVPWSEGRVRWNRVTDEGTTAS